MLTAVAGLMISSLLARLLSPAELGAYFLTVSLVTVATMTAQMGMQRSVVRLVAETMSQGRSGRARAIVGTVLRIGTVSGIAVGLAVGFGGRNIAEQIFASSAMADVVWYAAIWVGIASILGLLAESFRGFHDIRLAVLFTNLATNVLLVIMLAVVFTALADSDLRSVLSLTIVAGCIALVLAATAMRHRFAQLEKPDNNGPEDLIRISLPLLVASLAIFVSTQADLWIIGAFLSPEDVAVYGAAVRLVQLVAVPLMIINAILPPFVSELYGQGKTTQLENVIRVSATIAGAPAVVVLLIFVAAADPVLGIVYGDFYKAAGIPLVFLSLGQLISVWTGAGAIVLMMTGHQTSMMVISVLFGGLLVMCDLLVVKLFGVNGVALVSAVITALQAVIILSWVRHKTGMWTHGGFANLPQVARRLSRLASNPEG
jgi:O-antigen/teichoic acid export membrane protein